MYQEKTDFGNPSKISSKNNPRNHSGAVQMKASKTPRKSSAGTRKARSPATKSRKTQLFWLRMATIDEHRREVPVRSVSVYALSESELSKKVYQYLRADNDTQHRCDSDEEYQQCIRELSGQIILPNWTVCITINWKYLSFIPIKTKYYINKVTWSTRIKMRLVSIGEQPTTPAPVPLRLFGNLDVVRFD